MVTLPSTLEQLLVDEGKQLRRLLKLVSRPEDAVALLTYLKRRPVLISADGASFYALNELSMIFSFHLEALEGADLLERYRWTPESPGRYGEELQARAQQLAEVDCALQLATVGIEAISLKAYQQEHGRDPATGFCGLNIPMDDV